MSECIVADPAGHDLVVKLMYGQSALVMTYYHREANAHQYARGYRIEQQDSSEN